MKIIILVILFCVSSLSIADIKTFDSANPIKASEINENFSHIRNIFQTKQITIPFSQYTVNQLIEKNTFENDFSLVRGYGISITPLISEQIKASEINQAFQDLLYGATNFDDIPLTSSFIFSVNEDSSSVNNLPFVNNQGSSVFNIVSSAGHGSVLLGLNGSFTYTPSANYSGSDSFSFTVSDNFQTSNTSIVSINVIPVNDAPLISSISNNSFNEDSNSGVINFSITDVDSPLDCQTSVSIQSSNNSLIPVTVLPISGTAPNCSIVLTSNSNLFGVSTILITVSDTQSQSSSNFIVTVNAQADVPVAQNINGNITEDISSIILLSYSDDDGDSATSCSLSSLNNVSITQNCLCTSGICSVGIKGLTNYNGLASFQYNVVALSDISNLATVILTVAAVNDLPIANISSLTTEVNLAKNGTLTGSDIEASPLTYSIQSSPSKGTIDLNTSTGSYSYTPTLNQHGSDSFSFRTFDGTDFSVPANISINITTTRSCTINNGTVTQFGIGTQIFNTTTNIWNACQVTSCFSGRLPSLDNIECVFTIATGGTITNDGNYKVHSFPISGSFAVTSGVTSGFDLLVVAGGGGAGSSKFSLGGAGGGGAGGLIYTTGQTLALQSYAVTIGSGGNPGAPSIGANGSNGGNSLFGTTTAFGGGGGGNGQNNGAIGNNGGSGGGGGYNGYATPRAGGSGINGQGFAGGSTSLVTTSSAAGAGGGGAGGVGGINTVIHTGGVGGIGRLINITGTAFEYSKGGHGGGGHALITSPANSGYGGYAIYAAGASMAGGSGVVVIRYLYK